MTQHDPMNAQRKSIRLLGAVAATALALSAGPAGVAAAEEGSPSAGVPTVAGMVDEVNLPSGAEVFVYVPEGIELVSWTAPILLIMDDETFTAERAEDFAESTGLAERAKRDNAVISFVNPVNDAWGAADLASVDQIMNRLYIERPVPASWTNGRVDGAANGRTAEYPVVYAGYGHRMSVIANGGAADFVSSSLVDDALTLPMSPPPASWLPASVLLFNTSAVPNARYREWPAVVVNGAGEVNETYASLNPDPEKFSTLSSPETDTFGSRIIAGRYDELTSVRRQQYVAGPASNGPAVNETNTVLVDIPDYEELGVAPEQVNLTLSGNRNAMYLSYVPDTIDRDRTGTVPMVVAFHGSGERADWIAMHTGWPDLAAKEGFIVVSVDDHLGQRTPGSLTTDQVVELVDDAIARSPSIDRTRVYATGFSMGSVRTINIGTQRPDLFAAVVPMHVATAPTDARNDLILPTMYMAGERDPFPGLLPSHTSAVYTSTPNTADRLIDHLYLVNGVRGGRYAFDTGASNRCWGIEFDAVQKVDAAKGRSVYTINSLRSADGNVYTKLVNTSFLNHNNTLDQAPIAWEFMKGFSRNSDGSIEVLSNPDIKRPVTVLVSPSTSVPASTIDIEVNATDERGLRRIVANVYSGATLVKSTQTAIGGAKTGTHRAAVTVPDGAYTIRYNSEDLAGNISVTRTSAVIVDATTPVIMVKEGPTFTVVASPDVYRLVSFKLHDHGKIDKVVLNGVTKDVANNEWSDLNFVRPGMFGAVRGGNTLEVHDVAGNVRTVTFTLR